MSRGRGSVEGEAAAGLVWVLLLTLAIAIALVLFVGALLTELVRVFISRALRPSPVRRVLWCALAGLAVLWGISGLLLLIPQVAGLGAALAAWSFLALTICFEVCEWRERKREARAIPTSIRDVLPPWPEQSTPVAPQAAKGA
jgi:hypothetical protein